jgi:hypothetical protein
MLHHGSKIHRVGPVNSKDGAITKYLNKGMYMEFKIEVI